MPADAPDHSGRVRAAVLDVQARTFPTQTELVRFTEPSWQEESLDAQALLDSCRLKRLYRVKPLAPEEAADPIRALEALSGAFAGLLVDDPLAAAVVSACEHALGLAPGESKTLAGKYGRGQAAKGAANMVRDIGSRVAPDAGAAPVPPAPTSATPVTRARGTTVGGQSAKGAEAARGPR